MSDSPISTTGTWVTPEGRVVESEPVEGRQLVAPGTPITPDIRAAIDQAKAAAPPEPEPESEAKDETADDDAKDGKDESEAKEESAPARKRASTR